MSCVVHSTLRNIFKYFITLLKGSSSIFPQLSLAINNLYHFSLTFTFRPRSTYLLSCQAHEHHHLACRFLLHVRSLLQHRLNSPRLQFGVPLFLPALPPKALSVLCLATITSAFKPSVQLLSCLLQVPPVVDLKWQDQSCTTHHGAGRTPFSQARSLLAITIPSKGATSSQYLRKTLFRFLPFSNLLVPLIGKAVAAAYEDTGSP